MSASFAFLSRLFRIAQVLLISQMQLGATARLGSQEAWAALHTYSGTPHPIFLNALLSFNFFMLQVFPLVP